MKISSASKKVLASALSAAMVVAFSPAVALGGVVNGYDETAVGHNLDAGVITVAPTCEHDGLMTYTCQDGDGYSIIAAIKSTAKHVYSPNTAVFGVDANGFTWTVENGEVTGAALNLKCANGEELAPITATITKSGTNPSFGTAGEVTYTATAKDPETGKAYTSTKTIKSAAWRVVNGLTAGQIQWTDGYGVARVDVTSNQAASGPAVNKTQTLTAVTTSKAVAVAEGAPTKTKYTAEFDLPGGIFFADENNDSAKKYYIDVYDIITDVVAAPGTPAYTGADEAYVKDGKLVVEMTVESDTASTAHTVASEGHVAKAGTGFMTISADDKLAASAASDVAGTAYYVPVQVTANDGKKVPAGTYYADANTAGTSVSQADVDDFVVDKDKYIITYAGKIAEAATAGNAESFTDDGVTITYVGDGKIADGTAKADGVWTIETKCNAAGHATAPTVTTKTYADKVTKTTCDDGTFTTTVYTIEYAGEKYKLFVKAAETAGVATHGYVAKDTVWSMEGGNFVATTKYVCPVDGDTYTVKMSTNGDKTTGTAVVEHNGAEVKDGTLAVAACTVADAGKKASSFADGAVDVTLTLKRNTGVSESKWTEVIDAIGAATVSSLKGVEPRALAQAVITTVTIVPASSKATVNISDSMTKETKTYDLASEHVDATIDKDGKITNGYTEYTADITLPEGITELPAGVGTQVKNGAYVNGKWVNKYDEDYTVYQNADGSYSIRYQVADKVTAVIDQNLVSSEGFLPTEAAKWTVTDATGTKAETYVATAVTTADVAHSKKNPYQQKTYTVSYGNGKTLVLNATGAKIAHKMELKTFTFGATQTAGANTPDTSDDRYKAAILPVLTCPECGGEFAADAIILQGATERANAADAAADAAGFADFTKATLQYTDGDGSVLDLGEYIFAKAAASNSVWADAPVFKWTSTVTDAGVVKPAVTATFTSADGKQQVILKSTDDANSPILIELVDAATSTYKATIKSKHIPEGYTGTVSDTHVVSLHDGHSMVLEKVEKATTSKSGFAQYYCNNDGQLYKVAIAKNDMKVSPTSKSYKVSALKKKAQKFTIKVTNAKGAVSFKSSSKKVTVNKDGKVTVKKGTKKGTYKVTVTSKATDTYAKVTRTVSIKVK